MQRYQWGFSLLQLYLVFFLLLLWSVALMLLWEQANGILELNDREAASQYWKYLLTFTDKIKVQLAEADIDITNMSNKQLEDEIETVLDGGSISSEHLSTKPFSMRGWLRTNKLRTIIAVLTMATFLTEHFRRPDGPWTYWTLAGHVGVFTSLYGALCVSVAFATGATAMQRIGLFVLTAGICVPFFFYNVRERDFSLPGVCFGLSLAFAFGSTKGSRFVLFSIPFTLNYIPVLIWNFAVPNIEEDRHLF